MIRILILFFFAGICPISILSAQSTKTERKGNVVTEKINSVVLRDNLVGLETNRTIKVYLPPGYASSNRSYPVVYYCHSIFTNADNVLKDGNIISLTETAFVNGVVGEFILVVADYSTKGIGSIYENSRSTGRWLDFTVDEVVPYIDSHYRTLKQAESRAVFGEMMGGRGAFQLATLHPDIFSTAYLMNPVGTALGILPMPTYADWEKIHNAKSLEELKTDHISQIFVTMSQAFLYNPNRPPLYCDFLMERKQGKMTLDADHSKTLTNNFLVASMVDEHVSNLSKLRGIALDWSRYDPIQDHVLGSESLSRKLESVGIDHQAEAYRGVYWNENWKENGRYYARVLPFLKRHLLFEERK